MTNIDAISRLDFELINLLNEGEYMEPTKVPDEIWQRAKVSPAQRQAYVSAFLADVAQEAGPCE